MYKILIAGPDGCYPGVDIDLNVETTAYFESEQVECFSSMNPDDIEKCDGVIVPGGLPDVSPAYWDEENTGCHVVDEEMDRQQMAMIKRAVELRKPMLGICRGLQLVVVYFGGTLIQDITYEKEHCYEVGNPRFHMIRNVPGTFMNQLYGDKMKSNSGHHQAIKKLPSGFRVSQLWCADEKQYDACIALAEAGELHEGTEECIIEAIYHEEYPFIGLQWHPELKGELWCKHLDLSKIPAYFCKMMEETRQKD
ncbi:MAG: gamma-glutamyl-gamma-aminobutyrate hydrolase family protein [Dysosmobacter sp.]|nr:gamma-glutamyl-gamma-aminobutyrate hydrolase family protein [Dysosmobacter sp.]